VSEKPPHVLSAPVSQQQKEPKVENKLKLKFLHFAEASKRTYEGMNKINAVP
jgi:hypothetical protein